MYTGLLILVLGCGVGVLVVVFVVFSLTMIFSSIVFVSPFSPQLIMYILHIPLVSLVETLILFLHYLVFFTRYFSRIDVYTWYSYSV